MFVPPGKNIDYWLKILKIIAQSLWGTVPVGQYTAVYTPIGQDLWDANIAVRKG